MSLPSGSHLRRRVQDAWASRPQDWTTHFKSQIIPPGRLATLPVAFCLLIAALIFTVWSDALTHAPVAFETRGPVHHAWHYTLLAGALITLVGALAWHARAYVVELIGLILLEATVAFSTAALISAEIAGEALDDGETLGGTEAAVRLAVLMQLGLRIWILVARPRLEIPVGREDA